MKIGIIDYGCGNTSNIIKAFNKVGINCGLIKNKKDIMNFEKIILPGMGSASHAMRVLKQNKLDLYIKKFNENYFILIDICLIYNLCYNLVCSNQVFVLVVSFLMDHTYQILSFLELMITL